MNKAERAAYVAAARKQRRQPPPPAPVLRENGLRTTVLSPTRLRLDHAGHHWTLRRGLVDKTRVWVVNDGAVTLSALWRIVFTGVAPNLAWLQDELDIALNGG